MKALTSQEIERIRPDLSDAIFQKYLTDITWGELQILVEIQLEFCIIVELVATTSTNT